jgi:phage N-6-adenine-methyltransferase
MANESDRLKMSKKDEYRTPEWLLDGIEENHGDIDTDPSAGRDTEIGSEMNYSIEEDGLDREWYGTVFCNPPFSRKADFLEKALNESNREEVETIFFLTPDGTDVKSWWHKYIAKEAKYIWFSYGRICYYSADGEKQKKPTAGTAISVFGETTDEMIDWFDENGHIVKTLKN